MSDKRLFGPDCTPECYEYGTPDGLCPGWTHGPQQFDFSNPDSPCRYTYRVKVRRGERWFDIGSYKSRTLAQRIADNWGTPGNSMVSSEPRQV